MNSDATLHHDRTPPRRPLGLPFVALLGLAALGLPRVVLHDLHVIDEAGVLSWILAIAPPVVWVTVAVIKRVPHPFLTVLVIGALFGGMLVITHQLLWHQAFGDQLPTIGHSSIGTLIPRLAAVISGSLTGAAMGAVGGLVAWGIQAMTRTRSSAGGTRD